MFIIMKFFMALGSVSAKYGPEDLIQEEICPRNVKF